MTTNAKVEEKLKRYFDDKCIKVSEVATRTGIGRDKLAKVLLGTRELKAQELIVICKELKIPLSFFN